MIDNHVHTFFSYDGKQELKEVLDTATEKNAKVITITEHFDKDLQLIEEFKDTPQLNIKKYYDTITAFKEEYKDKLDIRIGLECGYYSPANSLYLEELKKYDFDQIINSIHIIDLKDCYYQDFFEGRSKQETYGRYVKAVRESLDAPYTYDILGHLGYISRYAPYENKYFDLKEFYDEIEDILKTLIFKGKALEINTHSRGSLSNFLPTIEIIKLYKDLGGELLSFGSDSHFNARLFEKYDLVVKTLKELGFNYLFTYKNHKPIPFKI